jgi:hypothetical protein
MLGHCVWVNDSIGPFWIGLWPSLAVVSSIGLIAFGIRDEECCVAFDIGASSLGEAC